DFCGRTPPIDSAVLFLEQRGAGRRGMVLRACHQLAADGTSKIGADDFGGKPGQTNRKLAGVFIFADGKAPGGVYRAGVETLVDLHEADARFRFASDDRPVDWRGAAVAG